MGFNVISWGSGWWLSPTPLKNDGVKVRWDDYSIPNMMGKKAMFQTTNQGYIYIPTNTMFGCEKWRDSKNGK
jgi:hypothetical protein